MSVTTQTSDSDTDSPSAALMGKSKGKNAAQKAAGKGKKAVAALDDLIEAQSAAVENLTKDEAYLLVPDLTNTVDQSYFKLGGVLAVIQRHEWWRDDGFDNFKGLIESRFGIQYRKAMYLIGIYEALVESGVPYEAFGNIGWTKIKEIAGIVTAENVAEWVERAQLHTTLQLADLVKQANSGTLTKTDETPAESTGVTTFNVKVHVDQKATIEKAVTKAMKEAGTEYKGVALESICLNYLSGAKVGKPLSLEGTLKKHTYEEVLDAFGKVFPSIDIVVKV